MRSKNRFTAYRRGPVGLAGVYATHAGDNAGVCPAEVEPPAERRNSVECGTVTTTRNGNDRRRVPVLVASAALLAVQFAPASEEAGRNIAAPGSVVADGRELIILHPRGLETSPVHPSTTAGESLAFAARSHEAGSQRIHIVELNGEAYRAATPIDGPESRILFDSGRRKFVSLLPSIRVELDEGVNADAVAEALGATRVTVFESVGFAIMDLPGDVHPVDAVRQVRNLPGGPTAAVRVRANRLEWK